MSLRNIAAAIVACGILIGAAAAVQEKDKPKSIKDVMALHKGKESFLAKITSGGGSEDDHKKLLAAYEVLPGLKAPQGDEKSWKEKTEALVAAAKGVVEKKEGAMDKLKAASNCKACHSVHRPPAK
jgi:hypothetical protein